MSFLSDLFGDLETGIQAATDIGTAAYIGYNKGKTTREKAAALKAQEAAKAAEQKRVNDSTISKNEALQQKALHEMAKMQIELDRTNAKLDQDPITKAVFAYKMPSNNNNSAALISTFNGAGNKHINNILKPYIGDKQVHIDYDKVKDTITIKDTNGDTVVINALAGSDNKISLDEFIGAIDGYSGIQDQINAWEKTSSKINYADRDKAFQTINKYMDNKGITDAAAIIDALNDNELADELNALGIDAKAILAARKLVVEQQKNILEAKKEQADIKQTKADIKQTKVDTKSTTSKLNQSEEELDSTALATKLYNNSISLEDAKLKYGEDSNLYNAALYKLQQLKTTQKENEANIDKTVVDTQQTKANINQQEENRIVNNAIYEYVTTGKVNPDVPVAAKAKVEVKGKELKNILTFDSKSKDLDLSKKVADITAIQLANKNTGLVNVKLDRDLEVAKQAALYTSYTNLDDEKKVKNILDKYTDPKIKSIHADAIIKARNLKEDIVKKERINEEYIKKIDKLDSEIEKIEADTANLNKEENKKTELLKLANTLLADDSKDNRKTFYDKFNETISAKDKKDYYSVNNKAIDQITTVYHIKQELDYYTRLYKRIIGNDKIGFNLADPAVKAMQTYLNIDLAKADDNILKSKLKVLGERLIARILKEETGAAFNIKEFGLKEDALLAILQGKSTDTSTAALTAFNQEYSNYFDRHFNRLSTMQKAYIYATNDNIDLNNDTIDLKQASENQRYIKATEKMKEDFSTLTSKDAVREYIEGIASNYNLTKEQALQIFANVQSINNEN